MRRRKLWRKKNVVTKYAIELETLRAHEEEFRGRHVIVIGNEIVGAKDGTEAVRLLHEMEKRHPGKSPLLSYIPEKDTTYILRRFASHTSVDHRPCLAQFAVQWHAYRFNRLQQANGMQ